MGIFVAKYNMPK